MTATALIDELTRLGVRLRIEDGRIVAKPLSAVPPEFREAARTMKSELLAILSNSNSRRIPCRLVGCPEHDKPATVPEGSRPLDRYADRWRAPMPLRRCSCGCPWFCLSAVGAIKCVACDPPADLALAEAWVLAREETGYPIPAEILSLLHLNQRFPS